MHLFSRRLLPALQLTRMALAFTAIADSQCGLLLRWARRSELQGQFQIPPTKHMLLMILVSVGLYGFGMSLNDIIDRRRDAQIAANRPLPSGRIGLFTAHIICIFLALCAIVGGAYYAKYSPRHGEFSFILVIGTGLLIAFYDLAGKYLVGLGLLSLGFIRFSHSLIASPELPVLWHPLLLLNHVTILSAVAYVWEEKRPALTRGHWWGVLGGIALLNALAISVVALRNDGSMARALSLRVGLILPGIAVLLFVALAWRIFKTTQPRRAAGQKLMLFGLLWLILYDASFAAVYVNWIAGLILLSLLPMAYFAVQLMRGWGQMLTLSQKPQYQRAGATELPVGDGRKK